MYVFFLNKMLYLEIAAKLVLNNRSEKKLIIIKLFFFILKI